MLVVMPQILRSYVTPALTLVVVAAVTLGVATSADGRITERASAKKGKPLPAWQTKGAKKLPPAKLKLKTNKHQKAIQCGQVPSKRFPVRFPEGMWVPVTLLAAGKLKGWSLPLSVEAANLKKQALKKRGDERKILLKQAAAKTRQFNKSRNTCSSLNSASPVGSGSGSAARLDLKGAAGLVQEGASSRSSRFVRQGGSGNLKVVTSSGATRSAFSSGSVTVASITAGPDKKAYISLNLAVTIDTASGETTCSFIESSTVDGSTTCISSSANGISNVQFDGLKRAYWNQNGLLYRWNRDGSAPSALTNNNIYVNNFIPLDSGAVIISGQTSSNNQSWTRLLNTSGGIEPLFPSATSTFLRLFPDGNVYMGGVE